MDNLNNIPNVGNWGDAASKLNDNFNKVNIAVETINSKYVRNKGYFPTLAALQTAFPSPKNGDTAYVANVASTTGYYIYNVVGGAWTASTVEAPPVSVPISNYAEHGYTGTPKTLKEVDDDLDDLRISLTNILKNSDFSDGLNNWTLGSGITDASVENGIMTFTGAGSLALAANRLTQNIFLDTNTILYVSVLARSIGGNSLYLGNLYNNQIYTLTDSFERYSYSGSDDRSPNRPTFGANGSIQIKEALCINLTEIFGAGNEPTKESMDVILENIGWFDGEHVVKNKDLVNIFVIGDFSHKADHGYTGTPKSLKQVEDEKAGEIAQLADDIKIPLTNILKNSDFSDGLNNWTLGSGITDASVENGVMTFTGAGSLAVAANRLTQSIYLNANTVIYVSVLARSIGGNYLYIGNLYNNQSYILTDSFERYSYSGSDTDSPNRPTFGASGSIQIKEALCINLTEIFGAGNEPTKERMDVILENIGWFSDEHLIKNKDLINVLMIDTELLAKKEDLTILSGGSTRSIKQVDNDAVMRLINLITNGNFVNDSTGWRFGSNITGTSVADSILSFIGGGMLGVSTNNWIRRTSLTIFPEGHILYNIVTARSIMGARFYVGLGYSYSTFDLTDQWGTYSYLGVDARGNHPTYGAASGDTVEMTNAMCFDLTEIFGAGKEPSKEEMDELLAIVSTTYFEGEYALPISELNQWLSSRFPQKQVVEKEFGEIDNILDLKFTNLITNSSFEDKKTGWTSAGNPGTDSSGSTIVEEPHLSGTHSLKIENIEGVRREIQTIPTILGHKYYGRGSAYIESFLSGKVVCVGAAPDPTILNEWQTVSIVVEATGTETEVRVGSFMNYSTFTAYFDEIIYLDLTAEFGAGNEPTKEEMDELFTVLDAIPVNEISTNDISVSQKGMFEYLRKSMRSFSVIGYGIMPLVTIANDDGRATDYELYKMMQKYGMRGTTFAVGTYVGLTNYLTEEQVKEMADAGWEIACHSYQHKNLTLETFPDGVIYQIFENKKFLESLTGKKVETIAHPFGGTNPEIRNLIRSFYEGARTSIDGYNDFGDVANVYNLKTIWTDRASKTVEAIKSDIDAFLVGKPRHLMLSGHALASEPGGDALTLSEMEEVCAHLKAYQMQGKLEVVTFAEAIRRIKSHPNYALL